MHIDNVSHVAWLSSPATAAALAAAGMGPRTSVLVLCYHRVGHVAEGPLAHLTVTRRELRRQLRVLRDRQLRFVDLEGLRRVLVGEDRGEPAVCVTFDDGYVDNLELAVPVLEEMGCPATFFVVTDRVGRTANWDPALQSAPLMTWPQLRELRGRGFGIGSHTRTHPWLTRVSAEVRDEELSGARATLEDRLGEPCRFLAYPYGDRDTRVIEAAAAAGYEMAVTVQLGFARMHTHPLQVPRCSVLSSDQPWTFALKVRVGWRSVELARRLLQGAPPAAQPAAAPRLVPAARGIEASPDEIARLGRRATQIVSRWFAGLDERPVCPTHDPAVLAALVDEPLPESGRSAEEVLDDFERLLPHATALPSPRYYGLLNPTPTPVGVFAEALAAAVNPNLGAWRHGTIGVAVEERVLRWLGDLFGLPADAAGTFTGGGAEANLSAIACARHAADPAIRERGVGGAPLVGYASQEAHFSLHRSFDVLGLGRSALRTVASDASGRMLIHDLRERIAADRAAGARPFVVVGILGTTSGGVVDPLPEIAEIAREEGLWFHVDAAYGGMAALSPTLAPLCAGVERADSIVVDPHKWLFVPFSAGVVLVRDGKSLRETFAQDPPYIRDVRSEGRVFFREGLQSSRRFNGLKVWLSLKRYGRSGYAAAIERQVRLAQHLHRLLEEDGRFTFPHAPVLGIALFRLQPPGLDGQAAGELALRLQRDIEREGRHWISTTVVGGERWLRVNVLSYLTREEHVRELAERLRREADALAPAAAAS